MTRPAVCKLVSTVCLFTFVSAPTLGSRKNEIEKLQNVQFRVDVIPRGPLRIVLVTEPGYHYQQLQLGFIDEEGIFSKSADPRIALSIHRNKTTIKTEMMRLHRVNAKLKSFFITPSGDLSPEWPDSIKADELTISWLGSKKSESVSFSLQELVQLNALNAVTDFVAANKLAGTNLDPLIELMFQDQTLAEMNQHAISFTVPEEREPFSDYIPINSKRFQNRMRRIHRKFVVTSPHDEVSLKIRLCPPEQWSSDLGFHENEYVKIGALRNILRNERDPAILFKKVWIESEAGPPVEAVSAAALSFAEASIASENPSVWLVLANRIKDESAGSSASWSTREIDEKLRLEVQFQKGAFNASRKQQIPIELDLGLSMRDCRRHLTQIRRTLRLSEHLTSRDLHKREQGIHNSRLERLRNSAKERAEWIRSLEAKQRKLLGDINSSAN